MPNRKRFPRFALILTLLIALCAGTFSTRAEQTVEAKPLAVVLPGDVVISEFRTTGPSGGNDEFIELYNPTNLPQVIEAGYKLRKSSGCSATHAEIYSFPSGVTLLPGQHYLVAGLGYSGTVLPDVSLSGSMSIADTGGIAFTDAANMPIDQVGMCSTTYYLEGTNLADITTTTGQSYERKLGGISDSCQDNDNNINDFQPISPSTPQNSSSPRRLCGVNADLSLYISTSNLSPAIGENVILTLTVINNGVSTATNVTVADNLTVLSDLTYVSHSVTMGSYNSGTWTIGTLSSGVSAILTINTTNNTLGSKTYQAEIMTSDQVDPDSIPSNLSINEDDDYLVIFEAPALDTSISVNNSNPNVGSNIVFTLSVVNLTSTNALNVLIDALLPLGLEFISTSNASYNSSTGILSIPLLAPGDGITFSITARVMSPNQMLFSQDVSATGFTNRFAVSTVAPIASTQADLRLTQDWAKSPTMAGIATLIITVENEDLVNTATGVQVRDLLPSGLDYVSHTVGMDYNAATGIWNIGTLNFGSDATLSITVQVSSSGASTTNFAEVWQSDQFDLDSTPGNGDVGEEDGESLEVPVADLSVIQTVDISGSNAIFTITVTNSGPDDVNVLKLKSNLPALSSTYTFVSAGSSQGTYDSLLGIWDVGPLVDGASATLVITTTTTGTLKTHWVEVSESDMVDPDSVPNNNSQTEDDDAGIPYADLSVSQTVNNASPNINSNVIFTITVTNHGPFDNTNVKIKDILPVSLSYVSSTPAGEYASGTGMWNVGNLASGASATLKITAKMTQSGTYTNWAEVWSANLDDLDSIHGNNSTTEDDDASATVSLIPTPTPTLTATSARSIVINEVAWAGTSSALPDDEWIELHNTTGNPINITGWRLASLDGSPNIILSGNISARGYFLLERDDENTVSDIKANQIYTGSLSNTGEILILYDTSNRIVDTANSNGGSWPAGSSSTYGSMERVITSFESDTSWRTNTGVVKNGKNANNGDILGTPKRGNSPLPTATPTPLRTATPTRTPTLPPLPSRPIINEILARPGFDWNQDGKTDVYDEFIEIKNLTAISISLKGWRLEKYGSTSFSLPDDTLNPGERIVFYSSDTNLLLSDGGETIRLINPSGKIYDAYTYNVARAEDKSFCRLPDGNPGNSWFEDCIPTPYLSNTREGKAPTSPDDAASPVCNLPDTIPLDFFIPECNGYGADIWNPFYWDFTNWIDKLWIQQTAEKWRTFIE